MPPNIPEDIPVVFVLFSRPLPWFLLWFFTLWGIEGARLGLEGEVCRFLGWGFSSMSDTWWRAESLLLFMYFVSWFATDSFYSLLFLTLEGLELDLVITWVFPDLKVGVSFLDVETGCWVCKRLDFLLVARGVLFLCFSAGNFCAASSRIFSSLT